MSKRYTDRQGRPNTGKTEDRMIGSIDELAEFRKFKAEFLPRLLADRKAGLTAAQIRAKYANEVELRKVQIALFEPDSTKALAACKDITDRVEGKPKEITETTHKFEQLKDEQLDALILSKLGDKATDDDQEGLN